MKTCERGAARIRGRNILATLIGAQESRLSGALDIVVTSPTKLLQHMREGRIFLRDVRWLVRDSEGKGGATATATAAGRESHDDKL
jgi:superfamily II DNA/RNA helicase